MDLTKVTSLIRGFVARDGTLKIPESCLAVIGKMMCFGLVQKDRLSRGPVLHLS